MKFKSGDLWKSKLYKYDVTGTSQGTRVYFDHGLPRIIDKDVFSSHGSDLAAREMKLTPAGALALDVKVSILHRSLVSSRSSFHDLGASYKKILNRNLSMLDDPHFSNFKFIVKSKEFKVHRNILAAASPVFAKLFTADMEEAQNGKCIVKDIEPKIFEHLLRFIYGGKLPEDVEPFAMELYEAAHYYGIDDLTQICKNEVLVKLSAENAINVYSWAWTYDVEDLKKDAWAIIKR
jgi:BTB/POZ domain